MKLSILLFSLLFFICAPADKEKLFIENLKQYSKKLSPVVFKLESYLEHMPLFDSKEKAIEYESKNLNRSKMDEDTYEKLLKNHVKYYTSTSVSRMIYTFKCLDLDTFIGFFYDKNLKQTVEIMIYHNGITSNYNLRSNNVIIYSNPTQARWTTRLFYYEKIYNQISRSSVELNDENDLLKLKVIPHQNEQYTLFFSKNRLYFPTEFEQKFINYRSVYEYPPFDTEKNLIPKIFYYKQYKVHPVTKKEWLRIKTKYTVKGFKIVPDLSEKDIDIELPPNVRVSDHIHKSSIKVSSDPDDPSTLFGIMKKVLDSEK